MPAPGGGRAAVAGMWCPACAGACLGATAEDPELWGMGLGRGTAAPLIAAFRGEMRASSAAEGPNTFCLCAPFVKSRTYVVIMRFQVDNRVSVIFPDYAERQTFCGILSIGRRRAGHGRALPEVHVDAL